MCIFSHLYIYIFSHDLTNFENYARNSLPTVDMGFSGVYISNIIFSDRYDKLFVYFCLQWIHKVYKLQK